MGDIKHIIIPRSCLQRAPKIKNKARTFFLVFSLGFVYLIYSGAVDVTQGLMPGHNTSIVDKSSEACLKPLINPRNLTNYTTAHNYKKEEEFKVPNVVHYIWYTDEPIHFRFDKALSVLSAIKYLEPDVVNFHTNMPPTGEYFEMLKKQPTFKIVHREPPKDVLKKIYFETDYSDYDKVKIIMDHGGIYLDLDVLVVKSFDKLRKFNCTLGLEQYDRICSGVIICEKNHPFLYLWLNSYYEDFRGQWAYNSGTVSTRLMNRYKGLIHVEKHTIHWPSYSYLPQIWENKTYDYSNNYAIHTWIRFAKEKSFKDYPTPESIKSMNSTYGKISRSVYYGSPDIIN